jgi:lysophospholipase L1-like esterase
MTASLDKPARLAETAKPARRFVALGASNLTRGFSIVVEAARAAGPVEIVAALGHGRSYGLASSYWLRRLPAILDSGLWADLDDRSQVETDALICDVGNDILYGAAPDQILAWVEECLQRLTSARTRVRLAGLPIFNIAKLSPLTFMLFRSALVPSCRLPLRVVSERAEIVHEGLQRLAGAHGAQFVPLRPEWYGLDPVHVRLGRWRSAFLALLAKDTTTIASTRRATLRESLHLYRARPERRWMIGREQRTPQPALRMSDGTTIAFY